MVALALQHHRHNNRYNARHKSKKHNDRLWRVKVPRQSSVRWSTRWSSASATSWSPPKGAGARPPGYLTARGKASATPSQGLALWSTRTARGGSGRLSLAETSPARRLVGQNSLTRGLLYNGFSWSVSALEIGLVVLLRATAAGPWEGQGSYAVHKLLLVDI